jgi:hypothetical protein
MGMQVCTGAMLQCAMGMAPSTFMATPKTVMTSNMDAGNILDFVPMTNIKPFGACTSLANPTVASATAAALGVLTPMPCMPATTTPWAPGSPTVLVAGSPALNDSSKLTCMWAGVISVSMPGQTTHQIP